MGKQGVLSYRTEGERTRENLTGLSGLAVYVDLIVASGVLKSLGDRVSLCGEQGWTDEEMALSLLLVNLAGGDCVDDLEQLNADMLRAQLDSFQPKRSDLALPGDS